MEAYLLLGIKVGWEQRVLEGVRKVPGVNEASLVFGPYDACVVVRTGTMPELNEVIRMVKSVTGVERVLTLIKMEG